MAPTANAGNVKKSLMYGKVYRPVRTKNLYITPEKFEKIDEGY